MDVKIILNTTDLNKGVGVNSKRPVFPPNYYMSIPERVKNKMKEVGLKAVNKPQRLNDSSGKSHHVMASEGGKYKYIKFGQKGVKTNQTAGQREAFKSRHAKNIKKGKMSAAYWADKVKWSPSKTKSPSKKWVKGS